MKLLFDENPSFRLPRVLADWFPESLHVEDVGLDASSDDAIRRYAVEHGFAIVTKDAEFAEHCLVKGAPPIGAIRGSGMCRPSEGTVDFPRAMCEIATGGCVA